MRNSFWFVAAGALITACGSPIAPGQADGADCNVTETNACGSASYCDDGPIGTPQRMHSFGFLNDGSHALGTCRPRGATGAPCSSAEACVSRNCTHATSDAPGFCGP